MNNSDRNSGSVGHSKKEKDVVNISTVLSNHMKTRNSNNYNVSRRDGSSSVSNTSKSRLEVAGENYHTNKINKYKTGLKKFVKQVEGINPGYQPHLHHKNFL